MKAREELAVPKAEFRSYYGRPVLKPPVWEWKIPAYLFTGGLAAGSALLAAGADLTGRPALRRAGRLGSFGALLASLGLLVADLGRPERFHHMLRVAKPTSPMSIGTWILTAFGPGSAVAAAAELLPQRWRTRWPGRVLVAGGPPGRPGRRRLRPRRGFLHGGAVVPDRRPGLERGPPRAAVHLRRVGCGQRGGLGLLATPVSEAAPARRLAVVGAASEMTASFLIERRTESACPRLHGRAARAATPLVGGPHPGRCRPRADRGPAQPDGRRRSRPGSAERKRAAAFQHLRRRESNPPLTRSTSSSRSASASRPGRARTAPDRNNRASRPIVASMTVQDLDTTAYAGQWQQWHREHEAQLAAPHGFLAITGLHWLDAEPQRWPDAPGTWRSADDRVTVVLDEGEDLSVDGVPVHGEYTFAPIPERGGINAKAGDAVIEVAKRGGNLIVRPRHPDHPLRTGFTGTPAYDPDPRWVLTGRYLPFAQPQDVTVGAVVEGLQHVYEAPGEVEFEADGQTLRLTAFNGQTPGALNILFTDATSGVTTYPANRSLRVAAPDPDGRVTLDFNHAVNLPCAYTEFATCPLPPAGNRLPVAVEAGEKTPA